MKFILKIWLIVSVSGFLADPVDGFKTIKGILNNRFESTRKKFYPSGNRHEFKRGQLTSVETLTNPEELKRAAFEAPEWDPRIAVIKKIDDPEVLKTIALKAWYDKINPRSMRKFFEIALMDAAEPMVEFLTLENLDKQDFQFLTESLLFLYAKLDEQGLKDQIRRSQKRYDVRRHSDGEVNC